jgi:hypothetical protein
MNREPGLSHESIPRDQSLLEEAEFHFWVKLRPPILQKWEPSRLGELPLIQNL